VRATHRPENTQMEQHIGTRALKTWRAWEEGQIRTATESEHVEHSQTRAQRDKSAQKEKNRVRGTHSPEHKARGKPGQ